MMACATSNRTLLLLVVACFGAAPLYAQDGCPALAGAWEYEFEATEGVYMATPTHGMWVVVDKDRAAFENQPPTESERAVAYASLAAAVVTHTCKGNRATQTYLYANNPNAAGTSVVFEFEIEGDRLTYWTLNEDGSKGFEGHAHRLVE